MNLLHRRYCRSQRWGSQLSRLLPWATEGVELAGAQVLELGSGPGMTTDWLAQRSGSLTALEYDLTDATSLAARRPDVTVLNGDARDMPLPDASMDVVVCFTMLHHLPSSSAQDELFAEAARVLRPGGHVRGERQPIRTLVRDRPHRRHHDPRGSGRTALAAPGSRLDRHRHSRHRSGSALPRSTPHSIAGERGAKHTVPSSGCGDSFMPEANRGA